MRYTLIATAVALFLIGLSPARAEDKAVSAPPQRGDTADVLATLRAGHPRLLWLDDDVARVKSLVASARSSVT